MSPNPTVYVIVRGDIPLADQAVQACHALWDMAIYYAEYTKATGWRMSYDPHLILLRCKSESELIKLIQSVYAENVMYHSFSEPDMNDELTALATAPISQELGRKLFKFPLWSEE